MLGCVLRESTVGGAGGRWGVGREAWRREAGRGARLAKRRSHHTEGGRHEELGGAEAGHQRRLAVLRQRRAQPQRRAAVQRRE